MYVDAIDMRSVRLMLENSMEGVSRLESEPTSKGSPISAPRFATSNMRVRFRLTHGHIAIAGSALFLLSNALIAPGLHLLPALFVLLGCTAALWIVISAIRGHSSGFFASPVDAATLVACALAAFTLCILGGEGHFFFANYDWLTRDAVLADLTRRGFPVFYEYQGNEFALRAPLGMYTIPATIGNLLGLRAAHLALLFQNAGILTATLTLLTSMVNGRRSLFLFIFLAFSGIEVVGAFIVAGSKFAVQGVFEWPLHMHQHLAWWNPFFQFTNNIAQIFWVPNHSLPGWWLAALSILYVRREIGSELIIVTFAFLFLWSPLTMAGALPIIGILVLRRSFREVVSPPFLLACVTALGFLPIVIYLGADSGSVPHRWMFLQDDFGGLYLIFILIQIPHAGIIALFWRRLGPELRTLSIISIVLLLIIPIYRLGANNDFVMRASIMPLALLAFVFGSIVANLRACHGIDHVACVVAIIVLGCITPALEIQRAFMLNSFKISDCNLLTTWNHLEPDVWSANYLVRSDKIPSWLLRHVGPDTLMTIEDRSCWPDHPYMNLPMTVWRQPKNW